MNQPKNLKEEPETEDSPMNQSQMFLHSCEGAAKLPIKQDYEEISADTKPSMAKVTGPEQVHQGRGETSVLQVINNLHCFRTLEKDSALQDLCFACMC